MGTALQAGKQNVNNKIEQNKSKKKTLKYLKSETLNRN